MSRRAARTVGRRVGSGAVMVKVRAARLLPRYGTDHDHFNTLVWTEAGVLVDESLEAVAAAVRSRKGASALCSGCHQPAPGYDQLAERRFEFIPLWGILRLPAVHDAACRLPALRRRHRRRGSVCRLCNCERVSTSNNEPTSVPSIVAQQRDDKTRTNGYKAAKLGFPSNHIEICEYDKQVAAN
jgi:hypothetical protein